MNLTNEQIQLVLCDPKLRPELLEFDDYSNIDLSNLDGLSDVELSRLKQGIVYVVENWLSGIRVYDNPPLMEMEPFPIYVYGIPGLYMVHEKWLESDEVNFFSTENEALEFADAAYSTFMSVYKTIVGEE